MTPQEIPGFDQGNRLLAETPAQLTVGFADTPHGRRLLLTIRTQTTTLTIFLREDDAVTWSKQLAAATANIRHRLIVAKGALMDVKAHPKGHPKRTT